MSSFGKSILITGGAGFIGTKLAKSLVAQGHEVTLLDSLTPQIHGDVPRYQPPDGVRFVREDVRALAERSDLLDDIDAIFHFAAETGTGQSMYRIARYVDINEGGTAALLEGLSRARSRRRRVVLASSRSIYGEGAYRDPENADGEIIHPDSRSAAQLARGEWDFTSGNGVPLVAIPTPETLPAKPGSVYAATKMSQELLLRSAQGTGDLSLVILRFQNVYGPGQSLQNPYTGIISIFFNRARQGLPINIYEDGRESRDFVYIDDVVAALEASLEADAPRGALNVGSGVPTSVMDVARVLCRAGRLSVPIEVSGDYRVGDIRHCYADLESARATLGFAPKVGIEEGLSSFVEWARTQPAYQDRSAEASSELRERGLAKG